LCLNSYACEMGEDYSADIGMITDTPSDSTLHMLC